MIQIRALKYQVKNFALDVSLDINDSEYFVLFGSTGCGKTSLLECLCGLRTISSGQIFVAGDDITDATPAQRRVGYVPQDGALFSHLSVRDNIGFALAVRGTPREEKRRIVQHVAGLLRSEAFLDRRVDGLSGGERQRVALARALVGNPKVLLLDEPVCALDEFTRDAVCRELVRVQKELAVPVIHVCHSFEEACMVADRVGIMQNGRIVRVGTPDELMNEPRHACVARLLRLENIFTGRGVRNGSGTAVQIGDVRVRADVPETDLECIICPWAIQVCDVGTPPEGDGTVVEGRIRSITPAGAICKVRLDGALPLMVHLSRREADALALKVGAVTRLFFDRTAVQMLSSSDLQANGTPGR